MTNRRRGYALIEVLVLITVVTAMLTLCAGMIHLLMRLDRAGRLAADVANDLDRLTHDFRDDAHASATLDPPAQTPERLTLKIPDGRTVEYQVRPGDVLRTVRQGEKVRRFEVYRRPARASVRIDLTSDGPRRFAALVIDRPPDGQADSQYRDYRIEAELGKDRRLSPSSE